MVFLQAAYWSFLFRNAVGRTKTKLPVVFGAGNYLAAFLAAGVPPILGAAIMLVIRRFPQQPGQLILLCPLRFRCL
jgi:hypothetical protein